jgi:hypothetical protein
MKFWKGTTLEREGKDSTISSDGFDDVEKRKAIQLICISFPSCTVIFAHYFEVVDALILMLICHKKGQK